VDREVGGVYIVVKGMWYGWNVGVYTRSVSQDGSSPCSRSGLTTKPIGAIEILITKQNEPSSGELLITIWFAFGDL
jgi:hypothetical protein